MSKYSISNRDLIIFFMVTFGLTIAMGIAMGLTYSQYPVYSFALVQMYYPGIGVMIALLLNKERQKEIPKKFYVTFLIFTITSVFYLFFQTFFIHEDSSIYLQYILTFGSLILFIMYFVDDKEKINRFGLLITKNWKLSIRYVVKFAFLYLCAIFLGALIFGNFNEIITPFLRLKVWLALFLLPLGFPFALMAFLGEEYGWRYFLQPALQERIGKIKGVILLGFIWGIWHLPLNLFYYSPATSFYSVINQLVLCITYSIFFGFVYLKTENIWSITIIHFLNNNLGFVLYGYTGAGAVLSWRLVLGNMICLLVIYLPFLFTKEYWKTEVNVSKQSP